MARDMHFVRTLMLDIESHPPDKLGDYDDGTTVDGREAPVVLEHVKLLIDAGFIAYESKLDSWTDEGYLGVRLTWAGTEFLDDIRSDTAWNRAMAQVRERAGSVAMAVVAEVARGVTRGLMNL